MLLLALCIIVTFFSLGLLEFWQRLNGWVHLAGIVAVVSGLAALIWHKRDRFRGIETDIAEQRIEETSGFRHRPFRSLEDRQATNRDDPSALMLWNHEMKRRFHALGLARTGWPRWLVHQWDQWALRTPAILLCATGLAYAGSDGVYRLAESLVPSFAEARTGPAARYDLWVSPPDYVAMAPFVVDPTADIDESTEPDASSLPAVMDIKVPEASELLAQIHHETDTQGWSLVLGEQSVVFEPTGKASSEARMTVQDDQANVLRVLNVDGAEQYRWPLSLVMDEAPIVAWKSDITMTQQKSLNLVYEASDDHAIARIRLDVRGPVDGSMIRESSHLLREPRKQPRQIDTAGYVNLLTHPLAGLPVTLTLVAEDAAGQTGQSAPLTVILPEREFTHPLAKEIIKQRKELASDPVQKRGKVASTIGALSRNRLVLGEHPVVFLSLHSASERLSRRANDTTITGVLKLLWDAAIFLEDGQLGAAEERLRAAQEALDDALERGAEQEELDRLMAELQQAMREYIEEMARSMQESGEPQRADTPMPQENGETISSDDLMEMLNQAQELMQTGQIEQAQELLAQLREMMENLQRPDGQQQQAQENPAEEALRGLQDVIREQRELLDETFQMQREQEQLFQDMQRGDPSSDPFSRPQPSQDNPMTAEQQQRMQELQQQLQQAQQQQENIRRQLGETMMQLGEMGMPIPDELGEAEMQMRQAGEQLGEGQPGNAVPSETQALQSLQQGGNQMMEQMAQQPGMGQPGQQQGQGQPNGEGDPMQSQQGNQPDGRDPLGRSAVNQGSTSDQGIKVPDQLDMGRARDVLDELRRRASDRTRPPRELNYLERLLDRF